MLPYLNLGPIGLPTAPLIYLLGVWLALFAVDRAARRLGQAPEPIYGVAAAMLLGGFVGARLVFVALYWSSFDDNLLGIVWPLTSGYHAAGGVVIGLAAGFFYGRWRRLALWPALDALAPGLIVFLMAVSLADFLGGAGYGSLTAMPWGINQFGVRRHAVQLYEVAAGLAALGVWWAATVSYTHLDVYKRQELMEGNRIKFSGVASTMMACPDMSIESALGKAIEMADNYAINGKFMMLHKAKMAPLVKFEAK